MNSDPMSAPEVESSPRAVAQPVAAPLTRAAIFLVVTLNPGFDNRAALRSFCGDLAAPQRADPTHRTQNPRRKKGPLPSREIPPPAPAPRYFWL